MWTVEVRPMAARVVPTLRLAVLCEDVEPDGNGRPALLAFPVHTLQFPPGVGEGYRPPTLHLYLQLQGGIGTFYVSVLLREQGEVIEVYRTPRPTEVVFNPDANRVVPLDLVVKLSGLTFPRPGRTSYWCTRTMRTFTTPGSPFRTYSRPSA